MADFPPMTDKAAEAFAEYVKLGPKRSQVLLAEKLQKQGRYKTLQSAQRSISKWSVEYQWVLRVSSAITEASTRKLERSAELDAETFEKTSEKLRDAIENTSDPRDVIFIRESVRKPVAKANTTVDVTHSGTIKHAHHDMSQFTDEEIDTLAEIARRQKVAQ